MDGSTLTAPPPRRGTFRFPGNTQRASLLGMTGSGKSCLGLWLLANASIAKRPWLIIDHKGEDMLDFVDRRAITDIAPGATVPKKPGLYYCNPIPEEDDKAVERMLWQVWERGRTGIYVDEAMTMPDCSAFDAIMVQGRSKQIPVILCSQRPVGISRYILTQSDFLAVFDLQDRDDQLRVEKFLNQPKVLTEGLPEYHCLWRDVGRRSTTLLTPCPPPDQVIDTLNARAPHRLWW